MSFERILKCVKSENSRAMSVHQMWRNKLFKCLAKKKTKEINMRHRRQQQPLLYVGDHDNVAGRASEIITSLLYETHHSNVKRIYIIL